MISTKKSEHLTDLALRVGEAFIKLRHLVTTGVNFLL